MAETQFSTTRKKHVESNEEHKIERFQKILIGTGFVMLGVAIVFFVYSHWYRLSDTQRAIALFLPAFLTLSVSTVARVLKIWRHVAEGCFCLFVFTIVMGLEQVSSPGDSLLYLPMVAIPLFGIFFGIWDRSGWEAEVSLLCAVFSSSIATGELRLDYARLSLFAGLIILIGFLFVVFAHFIQRVMIFYKGRQRAINSLLLLSFVLVNLYIIFNLTVTVRWTSYVGLSIFICMIAVVYGIIRKFLGLVKVACGVLIFDSWFFVLWRSEGIIVGIFATAILLIVLGQLLSLMKRRTSKSSS